MELPDQGSRRRQQGLLPEAWAGWFSKGLKAQGRHHAHTVDAPQGSMASLDASTCSRAGGRPSPHVLIWPRQPSAHSTDSGGQRPRFRENPGCQSVPLCPPPPTPALPLQGHSPAGASAVAATAPAPAPGGKGAGVLPVPASSQKCPCTTLTFWKRGREALAWFQNPETSGLRGIRSLTSTPASKPTSHLLLWTGAESKT